MKFFRFLLVLAVILIAIPKAHAAVSAPPCVPLVMGDVAPYPAQHVVGTAGQHVYWFCLNKAKETEVYGFSCPPSICSMEAWWIAVKTITESMYKDSATRMAWDKFITVDCFTEPVTTESGKMCVERASVLSTNLSKWTTGAKLAATVATALPVYKVKANGVYLTRPSRVLANGVLTPLSSTPATVGQLCNPTRPTLATGQDLWAEYAPNYKPGVVAVCAAVK